MSSLHTRSYLLTSILGLSLCIGCISTALAESPGDDQVSTFLSNSGNIVYLAAATGLPLLEDGKAGRNHTLRTLDALGTGLLVSSGLKALIREKRPDSNSHDSLPSSHATIAFAVAAVESDLHHKQAIYWYTGAALISASRFTQHKHTVGDVLAGAALGYGIGRLEMSSRRGLLLAPLIEPERHVYGISLTKRF
jgi:membrane-associated phospholipid phosphatase